MNCWLEVHDGVQVFLERTRVQPMQTLIRAALAVVTLISRRESIDSMLRLGRPCYVV